MQTVSVCQACKLKSLCSLPCKLEQSPGVQVLLVSAWERCVSCNIRFKCTSLVCHICRRRVDPEEEAVERASSDEDEFYDRTADGRARKLRAKDAPALDAATLYGRKVLLA